MDFAQIRELAENRDSCAMYKCGEGVPKNDDEAEKWYLTAFEKYLVDAEDGASDAQFHVDWMYR
ncbi:MAG: hypothetical protein IJS39_12370 [Synergistaceae bacterium]|nr:hypothetical protein [Synergistaceae bacterium]